MTELNLQTALLYILTFSYLTCYRGTLKTATIWGAFEFGTRTKKPRLKISLSLLLLVLVPIGIYSFESALITVLPLEIYNRPDNALLLITQISLVCIIILLLSLFPLATKHLWCVIAQCVEKKHPDAGWFNSNFDQTELEDPVYSWQVIVLNGLIPIALSFAIIKSYEMPNFFGSEHFF